MPRTSSGCLRPFVLPQVAYAVVIGLVAAFVMLKTRSVYPAMLVHAAVNAVVVAF